MSSAEHDPLLIDVLVALHRACLRCERVVERTSLQRLQAEEFDQLALAKAVEQIGEISHRVIRKFPDFVLAHPEIELRYAFQMRNRIAHGYEDLSWSTLWQVATRSVAEFRRALEPILIDAGEDLS
ncbi:HepT-like ribonuclease domain-containing protein [Jiella sonneratiae]|uniref:DUF86 domain-containing protein n=1 Tax=Jiella sonneratiae TaxID=2816856 RepID=A0ABS3IZM4_9HYPH|nr:DUF86 domain-containing protein [Jiella sonneratiae]